MTESANKSRSWVMPLALGMGLGCLILFVLFANTAVVKGTPKSLTARNECTNLVLAVYGFYDEYSHYPDLSMAREGIRTDAALMNVLLGIGLDGAAQNPKRFEYYLGKEAKGSAGQEYGGILRTQDSAELLDPWRKLQPDQERHYRVLWETTVDEGVADPFTGELLHQPVIAWSSGKDGKYDLTNPKAKVNKDNVYSWK